MLEIVEYSRAPAQGMVSTAANSFCAMRYGFFSSPTTLRENARIASVNTTCGARSATNGASSGVIAAGTHLVRIDRVVLRRRSVSS